MLFACADFYLLANAINVIAAQAQKLITRSAKGEFCGALTIHYHPP
jgi:hypothetical protein